MRLFGYFVGQIVCLVDLGYQPRGHLYSLCIPPQVLFPLLTKLLENINAGDPVGMEETRMRWGDMLLYLKPRPIKKKEVCF